MNESTLQRRTPTLFLKSVLVVIAIIVCAFCIFLFPHLLKASLRELPEFQRTVIVAFAGLYATALPFFYALYQAFKLLQYIDRNQAFSEASATALQRIKFSAIAMTAFYAPALPMAYIVAELDDAPGLVVISTAYACAPLVVATFAAVLQKLVRNAIDMKAEHDLTI